MKDDNERVGTHSGTRQSARSTDDDQRRQRRRRKSSSSSTEDGEVRAEDNRRRERRKKTGSDMQVEPNTDQTAYTSRRKKSTETALPKSTNTHADASACTAAQYGEEKKSTYTYDDASARPAIGRAADHHVEERISTRQLKPTNTHVGASVHAADRHAEERTTQRAEDAVSSTQRSDVDGDFNLQEPDHEKVTTTEEQPMQVSTELNYLRALQSGPLTTGASIEQEAQHQEVRFYSHQGNAYGTYSHGASLYGHMGDASGVYPSGNTSRPETYLPGRPDNAYSAYPNSVQHHSPDASMMEVNKVLLEQQQAGKPVVQFCEGATLGDKVMRPSPGSRQNTTVKKSAEQTPETTELEPAGTVYHTARTKHDDSSYRKEPLTKPKLWTKVTKIRQYDREEENGPSDASLESSSQDKAVVSPKHILKPPKFDGQRSFETFMAQFSNCAEYIKWNEAQKLAHLRHSLEKEVAYVLWDYGKDAVSSLSGLMKILETRFRGKVMADKHRIELRNRRRGADEMLQSVHGDIR